MSIRARTTQLTAMRQVQGQNQWLYASTNQGVLRVDLRSAAYAYIAYTGIAALQSMSSALDSSGECGACAPPPPKLAACAFTPSRSRAPPAPQAIPPCTWGQSMAGRHRCDGSLDWHHLSGIGSAVCCPSLDAEHASDTSIAETNAMAWSRSPYCPVLSDLPGSSCLLARIRPRSL